MSLCEGRLVADLVVLFGHVEGVHVVLGPQLGRLLPLLELGVERTTRIYSILLPLLGEGIMATFYIFTTVPSSLDHLFPKAG